MAKPRKTTQPKSSKPKKAQPLQHFTVATNSTGEVWATHAASGRHQLVTKRYGAGRWWLHDQPSGDQELFEIPADELTDELAAEYATPAVSAAAEEGPYGDAAAPADAASPTHDAAAETAREKLRRKNEEAHARRKAAKRAREAQQS